MVLITFIIEEQKNGTHDECDKQRYEKSRMIVFCCRLYCAVCLLPFSGRNSLLLCFLLLNWRSFRKFFFDDRLYLDRSSRFFGIVRYSFCHYLLVIIVKHIYDIAFRCAATYRFRVVAIRTNNVFLQIDFATMETLYEVPRNFYSTTWTNWCFIADLMSTFRTLYNHCY